MPDLEAEKSNRRPSKRTIYLITALIACVVAVVVIFLVIVSMRKSAIELQYGDYSITKERYEELVKEAQSAKISSDKARRQLILSLKAQAAAKSVGVEESRYKTVAAVAASDTAGKKITDIAEESYHQRVKYPAAIESAVEYLSTGGHRFATFEFPLTQLMYDAELNAITERMSVSEYYEKNAAALSHEKIRESGVCEGKG